MHLPADQLPPVNAFWSLTLYDEQQLFVANTLNRFAIGDRDPLGKNADGSLDLYLQHALAWSRQGAQLAPDAAAAGRFALTLRLYWPKPEALDGTWSPPPVVRDEQVARAPVTTTHWRSASALTSTIDNTDADEVTYARVPSGLTATARGERPAWHRPDDRVGRGRDHRERAGLEARRVDAGPVPVHRDPDRLRADRDLGDPLGREVDRRHALASAPLARYARRPSGVSTIPFGDASSAIRRVSAYVPVSISSSVPSVQARRQPAT